jgi:hypothetical protein
MKKIAGTSRSRRTRKAYRSVWWYNAADYCPRLPTQKRTDLPQPDLMEPAKPGTQRRKDLAKRIAIPSLMAARELSEFNMSARLRRLLNENNFRTLGDLRGVDYLNLLKLRNCCKITVLELEALIRKVQHEALIRLSQPGAGVVGRNHEP